MAKNYLLADEIGQLGRLVTMWLDYAEDQTQRIRPIYMKYWREKMDSFLQFNQRAILEHSGKISRDEVVSDAISALLTLKPRLKIDMAVNLYRNKKVSLWRAADIASRSWV